MKPRNPQKPSGSQLEQLQRRKTKVLSTVFVIVAAHVLPITGLLLMQGCKPDAQSMATNTATSGTSDPQDASSSASNQNPQEEIYNGCGEGAGSDHAHRRQSIGQHSSHCTRSVGHSNPLRRRIFNPLHLANGPSSLLRKKRFLLKIKPAMRVLARPIRPAALHPLSSANSWNMWCVPEECPGASHRPIKRRSRPSLKPIRAWIPEDFKSGRSWSFLREVRRPFKPAALRPSSGTLPRHPVRHTWFRLATR